MTSSNGSFKAPSPVAVILDGSDQKENDEDHQQKLNVHSLPCYINYSGPAHVETFFHPESLNINGIHSKAATFRGHLLLGKNVEMTEGFRIYAVSEDKPKKLAAHDESGNAQQKQMTTFKIHSSTSAIDHWEYDELPVEINKKNLQTALIALRITGNLAS